MLRIRAAPDGSNKKTPSKNTTTQPIAILLRVKAENAVIASKADRIPPREYVMASKPLKPRITANKQQAIQRLLVFFCQHMQANPNNKTIIIASQAAQTLGEMKKSCSLGLFR